MSTFSGRFAFQAAGRGSDLQGPCQLSFDEETLTLSGGPGVPLAFDLGDIDAFLPGDYELRLALYTGQEVQLRQFGKSFQDLERELREAYRNRLVQCLLVGDLNEVARYTARIHLESARRPIDAPGEIRLYESNLAVLPDSAPGFQWRLADLTDVTFDETAYSIVVRRGHETLSIGKLAKRTSELHDFLRKRIAVHQERGARILRALFPFLTPDQFRQVAALMPEGTSASIARLGPIHRLIEPSLLEQVVRGSLRPYLSALMKRCTSDGWFAGFKIIRRDEEESGGAAQTEEEEAAPAADAAADDQPPVEDKPLDEKLTDVGDETLTVLYWFFVPVAGKGASSATHLVWEATSEKGRASYVFRTADAASPGAGVPAAISNLSDGLVAINFRREPVYLSNDALETHLRYRHYAIAMRKVPEVLAVRRAFVGRGIHTTPSGWQKQIDQHLAR